MRFKKGTTIGQARRIIRKKRMVVGRQFYGKRGLRQPVHYFTRTQYLPNYYQLIAGGAGTGAGLNFQLANLPNYTEFTGLYDQYMIKGIKISLIPKHTETGLGTTTQANMWSVIDMDDSTGPANLEVLLQYANVKRTRMNQVHTRYLKPAVSSEVYATGIASTYAPKKNVWLDATNANVEHYGVKLWFDARGTQPVTFDVQVKYYLAMKSIR